jgi:hypothetical protein
MSNTLSDYTHAEAAKHEAERRMQDAVLLIEAVIGSGLAELTYADVDEYNAARAELIRMEGQS